MKISLNSRFRINRKVRTKKDVHEECTGLCDKYSVLQYNRLMALSLKSLRVSTFASMHVRQLFECMSGYQKHVICLRILR